MTNAIIGLNALLLGGAVAWIAWYFWREGRDLRTAGVEARATLLKKFRKSGNTLFSKIENCFVTAEFLDAQGRRFAVDIGVPSRQWHWLREGAVQTIVYLPTNPARARVISRIGQTLLAGIMLWVIAIGAIMALFGLYFALAGLTGSSGATVPASIAPPPPTKFDKTGVAHVAMAVSPRHDRIAVMDEDGSSLRIRELPSGQLLASAKGKGWRIIGWRPDGARLAVTEAGTFQILDSSSLQPAPGETLSWIPGVLAPSLCPGGGEPSWNPAGTQAAIPCGNDVLLFPPNARLKGHVDRVVAIAWSPSGRRVASASEDNYVRAWDAASRRCIGISEDYPYPRAIYFKDENTVVVIDVALRQYQMRI